MKNLNKLMALLLTLSIVLSYVPMLTAAEDICAHHTHDETCGYVEANACGFVCEECNRMEDPVCTGTLGCPVSEHYEGCEEKIDDEQVGAFDTMFASFDTLLDEAEAEEPSGSVEEAVTGAIEGSNLSWKWTADGTLTISGEGDMADYNGSNPVRPWKDYVSFITKIVIEDGVTSIGSYAFSNSFSLKNVSIPNSVRKIGGYAFSGCSALEKVAIPSGVTQIASGTFTGCSAMAEVNLPDTITDIDSFAFQACSGLTEIDFPESLQKIGDFAFYDCTALESLEFPEGLQCIGQNAFSSVFGNKKIERIEIPNGVTNIGKSAFSECHAVTNVKLSSSLTEIEGTIFYGCGALTSITIPSSVRTIWGNAFYGCTGLQEIIFDGNAPEIYCDAFSGVTAKACYPQNDVSWTADKFQNYGGNITWTAMNDGNDIILGSGELAEYKFAWIDGVEYPIISDGKIVYVDLPDGVIASSLIIYSFHEGDADDVHMQYPTSMKVWMLEKNEDGSYLATRAEELDDILQYAGTSIRVSGKQGIRMITSVPRAKKDALTGSGLAGYRLLEYGTVIARASELEGGKPLTLGQSHAKSNYAYKRGVADPVFAYSGDLMQYTNVLVGFGLEDCKDDIAMRSYMIIEGADGMKITLYGGIVYRSIGYVAYQNRSVFDPASAAYHYVWEIIHSVYGDRYDAEYKG